MTRVYMYVHRDRLPHLLRHGQSYMHTLGPIAGDILAIYLNPPLRSLCAGPAPFNRKQSNVSTSTMVHPDPPWRRLPCEEQQRRHRCGGVGVWWRDAAADRLVRALLYSERRAHTCDGSD